MIIMSVDLGLARTGIALCDKDEALAFPKTVIKEYNQIRLIEKIALLAKEYGAELIVMGHPKNMDGSEGERALACRQAAEEIESKSGIKTVLWDERCTTVVAHNILSMNDRHGKKRKQTVDAVAATVILEGFLEARRNKKA